MKNILILPPAIFKAAKEAAASQGLTLIELCQRATIIPVDDVIEEVPPRPFDGAHTYEGTGLEA